jgi:aminoglycoside phosphotransferase (APT) family kinase protein
VSAVAITEEAVAEFLGLLGEAFPARSHLAAANFAEITEGWETRIFSFTLSYKEEGEAKREELVLRFYEGDNQKAQANKEYSVMKKMAAFGVSVPQVVLLVTENSPFGSAFVLMEKINGATMSAALVGAGKEKILALMDSMVKEFVRVHQTPWQDIFDDPGSAIQSSTEPPAYVKARLAEMRNTADQFRLREFEPFFAWLEERMEQGAAQHLCVMHNDYHPGNLLMRDQTNELVVVDWSFAEVGDYRLDLAWSVMLFAALVGPDYREPMVRAYAEAAGAPVENFSYFEVLKLTMRMLTIATWLDESVEIPVKKITREAIRGDYKIHVLNPYRRLREITGLFLPIIEEL